MAVKKKPAKVEITEDEAWADIDKLMEIPKIDTGERDIKYFMDKFGIKRNAAVDRLGKMEADGILKSRVVFNRGHWTTVYRPVAKTK